MKLSTSDLLRLILRYKHISFDNQLMALEPNGFGCGISVLSTRQTGNHNVVVDWK